jgi:predicted glycoside hydrolase/deacetylase ChbG (UPF0249 family)
MNRNLIITADDYGMCRSVNEGIDACLQAGAVRATCVMVNMPASEAAVSLRSRFPGCSVGIHWTLTQGKPVLSPVSIPTLVNSSGEFHSIIQFRRRWLSGRIRKEEVRRELRAQADRLIEISGFPEFWNTHENFHVLPGLFQYCAAIARQLGIPAMRCHTRITVPLFTTPARYHLSHPMYWLKGAIIRCWSRKEQQRQVCMPDGRLYMPGYKAASVDSLEDIAQRLPWRYIRRAVEVVVHPATRVEEGFGILAESRVREYEVLRDFRLAGRLHRRGIKAAGFEVVLPGL